MVCLLRNEFRSNRAHILIGSFPPTTRLVFSSIGRRSVVLIVKFVKSWYGGVVERVRV